MLCRVLCALLFVAWTAEWPLEFDQSLYCGLWRSPFQVLGPLFVSLPGINLFPFHLILIALTPFCLFRPGASRGRASIMDVAILISVASVAVTFLWGFTRGGSAYNAYFQLWRFLLALLIALLLHSTIRNARDLRALGLTVLAAALVRGTLVIYFYWAIVHGKIDPPPPHMTNHDDTLLFVGGVLIMVSWAAARGTAGSIVGALCVSGFFFYAIMLNNRRLAWIELVLAFGFVYLLLAPRGWRVHRWAVLFGPILLAYLVVGWGQPGAFFAPARALATAGSNADASSLARQEEVRNLLYTLANAGNPLLGTGWGVPYQKVTSVYSNFGPEWWQYLYLPHNSLLAVAVFGGLVGICGIWIVVPVTAFLATRGYRAATRPVERAGAMTALCILPAYAAQCYGDIGFQSLTCGLILGVTMAAAGKVSAWAAAPPERVRTRPAPPARARAFVRPARLPPVRMDARLPARRAR